jgi:hypothetical protein
VRRAVRSTVAALLATAAVFGGAAVAGQDDPPASGGSLVEQCYAQASTEVDDGGYKFCRSMQAADWGAAAAGRTPMRSAPDPALAEQCAVVDGRRISAAQIDAYEQSWVHRALTLQRDLSRDLPLWQQVIPHSHNSFNSSAYAIPTDGSLPSYYATLTNQDPNQVYSLTDQLRMDIRALEIDVHWVPSPFGTPQTHGYWPTMCHGQSEDPAGTGTTVHVGCTYDRPLQDGLAEVRRWLDAHPRDVVLVYLENQLFAGEPLATQRQAHDVTADLLKTGLGDLVYKPPAGRPAGQCASLPYDRSRANIAATGARVVLVGNCGPGAWGDWVFERGSRWDESGKASTYDDKACAADVAAYRDKHVFRRYYEESPWLEAMTDATDRVSPAITAHMVRCGATIIGFDQLEPFDGRLQALVWSWAADEPGTGDGCAVQGTDGRFHGASCAERHRVACVDSLGGWHVTRHAAGIARGAKLCRQEFPGSAFSVPRTTLDNQALAAARPSGVDSVWLDYVRDGATWRPEALR